MLKLHTDDLYFNDVKIYTGMMTVFSNGVLGCCVKVCWNGRVWMVEDREREREQKTSSLLEIGGVYENTRYVCFLLVCESWLG